MNIQIVQGDITKQTDVEAIVNAANKSLLGGGGIDGTIHRAAGKELLAECRTLGGCNTGESKITGAYNLPCKYVIHTVGPIYRDGNQDEALLLASAYRNCMKLALSKGIRSLAFPAISTGRYSYPLKEATEIALKTVIEVYKSSIDAFDLVRFVVPDSKAKKVYDDVVQTIKSTDVFNVKDNERPIDVKDFVVRRSVFKCMHNEHELKTVIGIVTVIDSNLLEKQMKVNAGYCADCNLFFILESTYNKIRQQGIPLCRTCDEKKFLKQKSANGMLLAKESILMQYGYTVDKLVDLSSTTRQKILAMLIDHKILEKSEIITYLDFFINQRESRSQYKLAIAKWKEDREFVENYKNGTYQQYYVSGITRK